MNNGLDVLNETGRHVDLIKMQHNHPLPEDFGIAGFDDMPFLTGVDSSAYCGVIAPVQALIDSIDTVSLPHQIIILPTALVNRSSNGPSKNKTGIQ